MVPGNKTIAFNVSSKGLEKAPESLDAMFERKFNNADRQRLWEGAIIGGRFNSPVLLYNWTVIYYKTSSICRNVVITLLQPQVAARLGVVAVRSAVQRSADVSQPSTDGRILNSWLWKHTESPDQLFRWPFMSQNRLDLEIK